MVLLNRQTASLLLGTILCLAFYCFQDITNAAADAFINEANYTEIGKALVKQSTVTLLCIVLSLMVAYQLIWVGTITFRSWNDKQRLLFFLPVSCLLVWLIIQPSPIIEKIHLFLIGPGLWFGIKKAET